MPVSQRIWHGKLAEIRTDKPKYGYFFQLLNINFALVCAKTTVIYLVNEYHIAIFSRKKYIMLFII